MPGCLNPNWRCIDQKWRIIGETHKACGFKQRTSWFSKNLDLKIGKIDRNIEVFPSITQLPSGFVKITLEHGHRNSGHRNTEVFPLKMVDLSIKNGGFPYGGVNGTRDHPNGTSLLIGCMIPTGPTCRGPNVS